MPWWDSDGCDLPYQSHSGEETILLGETRYRDLEDGTES